MFGFLLRIMSLINGVSGPDERLQRCADLGSVCEGDINGSSLHEEITECQMLLRDRQSTSALPPLTPE